MYRVSWKYWSSLGVAREVNCKSKDRCDHKAELVIATTQQYADLTGAMNNGNTPTCSEVENKCKGCSILAADVHVLKPSNKIRTGCSGDCFQNHLTRHITARGITRNWIQGILYIISSLHSLHIEQTRLRLKSTTKTKHKVKCRLLLNIVV